MRLKNDCVLKILPGVKVKLVGFMSQRPHAYTVEAKSLLVGAKPEGELTGGWQADSEEGQRSRWKKKGGAKARSFFGFSRSGLIGSVLLKYLFGGRSGGA